MAIFENDICPVCQKAFEAGDDIVVCPECGTPHHRECYNQLGRCANSALHAEGFVFKRAASEKAENEKAEEQGANIPPFFASLMADAERQSKEAETKPQQQAQSNPFTPPQISGQSDIKEIDGQPVGYIATAVGANARRFVNVFSRNKTVGWNWSAFIFGPFYFLYRKMLREGLFVAAFDMVIRIGVMLLFKDSVDAYNQGYSAIMQGMMNKSITNAEAANQISALLEASGYMRPATLILVLLVIVHILCALFADGIYKKKIISIVKEADSKLEEDAFFGVTPFMGQPEDARPEEIKMLYLSSKGGVSFFIPLCAYFVLTLLNML